MQGPIRAAVVASEKQQSVSQSVEPRETEEWLDILLSKRHRFPMRGPEPSTTRFRRGTENRGFNQIKKMRQITPKNKLHYLSEKKCLVLGAPARQLSQ